MLGRHYGNGSKHDGSAIAKLQEIGGQHTNFLQIIQAPPVTKTASALALRDSSVPTIENRDGRMDTRNRKTP